MRTGPSERTEQHGRERYLGGQTLATSLGIATNLEGAAEWRELRAKASDMAGRARLAGLLCKCRHGTCPWHDADENEHEDRHDEHNHRRHPPYALKGRRETPPAV